MTQDSYVETLLSKKFESLHTFFSAGMTWWVSAVVFSGTIVLGTFIKQGTIIELYKNDIVSGLQLFFLFCLIAFFLFSIVVYGLWCVYSVMSLHRETKALFEDAGKLVQTSEFLAVQVGYCLGTSSFVLIFLTWLHLGWKFWHLMQ